MALAKNTPKDHGSYLAAAKFLAAHLGDPAAERPPLADDQEALRFVGAMFGHLVKEPYCTRCNGGRGLESEEAAAANTLLGEVIPELGLPERQPLIVVEGPDGGDDVIMENPFTYLRRFLDNKRLNGAAHGVRRASNDAAQSAKEKKPWRI